MREKKYPSLVQVRVSEDAAKGLNEVAAWRGWELSQVLRYVIDREIAGYREDLARREALDQLAQTMTPWLHGELRARGVKDPEKYEVRYE